MKQETLDKANDIASALRAAEYDFRRTEGSYIYMRLYMYNDIEIKVQSPDYSVYLSDRDCAKIHSLTQKILMTLRKGIANRITELKQQFKDLCPPRN